MSVELAVGIFGIAALFAIVGAIFVNRISGGAVSTKSLIVKPFKILLAPLYMLRVFAVFIFVAIGVAFLLMAPFYITYPQITGYRYSLELQKSPLRYLDMACKPTGGTVLGAGQGASVSVGYDCVFHERYTLDRAVVHANLYEYPVTTYHTVLLFRPDYVLLGLVFTIVGCILTAYFLARSNTMAAKAEGRWVERPE
jgi:hypothetical protein